jgi:dihydropyrimidinase
MGLDIKIVDGTLADEAQVFRADIGISGGKIAIVAREIHERADRIISAAGSYVLPGGIDPHVHLSLPFCGTVSADDFSSGTRAAACGGVTTVIDFAIQGPGTVLEAVRARRAQADPEVCTDYSLHAGITRWDAQTQHELPAVMECGITSFKLFMVYRKEGWMADDFALYEVLRESARRGGLVGVHAENVDLMEGLTARLLREGKTEPRYFPESRPAFIEGEAIGRAVRWARASGGNLYIFHLSSAEGVEAVAAGKCAGVRVCAETAATYLGLTDERFGEPDGHLYATCPPVRTAADNARLWEGLMKGEIEVLATDHCAFSRAQKEPGRHDFTRIPYGMPSVEVNLPLVFSAGVSAGRMSLPQFVRLSSTNAAKLFGLYPTKGSLQVGADADLTIWDPRQERTLRAGDLHMRVDWSPFEGRVVTGYPRMTLLRGEVICDGGRFLGTPGSGRFLARGPTQYPDR